MELFLQESEKIVGGLIFLIPGLLISAGNLIIAYKGFVKHEKTSSPAYLLGGFLIQIALIGYTYGKMPFYLTFIAYFIDGTVPAVIYVIYDEFIRKKTPNDKPDNTEDLK